MKEEIVSSTDKLLLSTGRHPYLMQGQNPGQNHLSTTGDGGDLVLFLLHPGTQETTDLDHHLDLITTQFMTMEAGHIETIKMAVIDLEGGIWIDHMIIIYLAQGEIGVGVEALELENHIELIQNHQNAV